MIGIDFLELTGFLVRLDEEFPLTHGNSELGFISGPVEQKFKHLI